MQWLGFVVDLSKGQIKVPGEHIAALRCKLEDICQLLLVPAKQLARSIISMSLAIGPVSRFKTRCMYILLETRHSWWEVLEITLEDRQELGGLVNYNCQPI